MDLDGAGPAVHHMETSKRRKLMTLRCKTSWLFPLRHLCQWRGLGQLPQFPWYLEKLRFFFSLQTAKNQVGTYSERCPPFRSFRHLQSVHHLMCPPRDRWFLNHVIMSSCLIMSHHVIWNTWSQSGANGCAGVLARRMLRG